MAPQPIKKVAVIGGGIMGSGIALITAANGYNVTLVEINSAALASARKTLERNMKRTALHFSKGNEQAADKFYAEATARMEYSAQLEDAVRNVDLVIEAIVENLAAKQQMFRTIDAVAPPHTIFASNTSSLSIAEVGSATTRRDRFGGLHFFNPVPLMKLLEVVKTDHTSEGTIETLLAFGTSIRKTCITCKDMPGFVVNRLLFPVTSEAIRMVERGDATTRDIDTAMKLGLGHPMGPFELMDIVGIDTVHNIMAERHASNPTDEQTKPSVLLDRMVRENKLGVKSGEGFYNYK